jgi:hydroxymethylpyrimidine pyrophosphatase-like HAD family hydrolase
VGIDVGDVVAFGDEANDLPLLLAAGDGVAMANATDEVRAVADHVTSSNDDAGVAAYFRL